MRPPGLPSKRCRPAGRQQIREVSRVQSGGVLLQGARRAAHGRARESVQGADSDLRLSDVQEASRRRYQVSAVQGGDVLQQEAQGDARVGAREQVRGAVLVQINRQIDTRRDLEIAEEIR
jgi:hypothetical protein